MWWIRNLLTNEQTKIPLAKNICKINKHKKYIFIVKFWLKLRLIICITSLYDIQIYKWVKPLAKKLFAPLKNWRFSLSWRKDLSSKDLPLNSLLILLLYLFCLINLKNLILSVKSYFRLKKKNILDKLWFSLERRFKLDQGLLCP